MLCLLVEAADFRVPHATDHLLYRWTCDAFGDKSQLRTKDCFLTFLQQHVATSLHEDFTLTVLELYSFVDNMKCCLQAKKICALVCTG